MIRDAVLRAFSAGTYLADVQLSGSLPTYLAGIPVARNIAAGELTVGRRCAVAFFGDGSDPTNVVLIAVWP